MPGLTHWQHPSFFAYFPANVSTRRSSVSCRRRPRRAGHVLGDESGLHRARDARAGLDGRSARAARARSGPSGRAAGSSRAARRRHALRHLAARERVTEGAGNHRVQGPPRRVRHPQAHRSVEKAARIAGIGSDNVRWVAATRPSRCAPTRWGGRSPTICPGRTPFFVRRRRHHRDQGDGPGARDRRVCRREDCGCTSTPRCRATPPLPGAAPAPGRRSRGRQLLHNPHKWLGVNFDCDSSRSATARPWSARSSILPEYLRTRPASGR